MKQPNHFLRSSSRFWSIAGLISATLTMSVHAYDISEERRNLCENINNSYQCAQAIENVAMKKSPKVAERREGQLTFYAAGKQIASFTDSEEKKFTFQGLLSDISYALVEVQYSEGSDFLLIHVRTGQQTRIKGLPIVSPDRRHFVTASGDEAGYTETALEIFSVNGSSTSLETSIGLERGLESSGWPANPRWINTKTIVLSILAPDGSKTIRSVYWTATGWRLKHQSPAVP